MTEVTNDLIYEVLKAIQSRLCVIEAKLTELRENDIQTREGQNRLEAGLLRIERMDAGTQVRLDRLENRLNLKDA